MNTDYTSIFEDTAQFLLSKGVTPSVSDPAPASIEDLAKFTEKSGITLPKGVSQFYTQFSDGYEFSWEDGDDYGFFSMPALCDLIVLRRNGLPA